MEAFESLLLKARRIAVVGASPNPLRPSNRISHYLMDAGYEVIPVNPGQDELYGLTCYPDVSRIPGGVDIVDIFRRSDQVYPIVESSVAVGGVQLIWMQDGVINQEASELASSKGIEVVMDDCILRVHRRLKLST